MSRSMELSSHIVRAEISCGKVIERPIMGQSGLGRVAVTNSLHISVAKHNTRLYLTCAKGQSWANGEGEGLLYVVLKVMDPLPLASSSFTVVRGQESDEWTEFYGFL